MAISKIESSSLNQSAGAPSWDANGNQTSTSTGTSTSHRGNVVQTIKTNGSGFNTTSRLSDGVANSTDMSMLGGVTQFSNNGIVSHTTNGYGIGLGATTPSNGTGLAFPATQSPSSDANTLDDYEEGTWNPTDASGAGLTFPQSAACFYRKIGTLVFVSLYINYPSTANSSAALIGGLPFTAAAGYFYMAGRCGALTGGVMRLQINSGSTQIVPYNQESITTNAQLSTGYMIFSGCYVSA